MLKQAIFYSPLSTYPETGQFLSQLEGVHNFRSENDDHKMVSNAKGLRRQPQYWGRVKDGSEEGRK